VGLASSDATLKASLPLHKTDFPEHRPEPEIFFFGSPMIPIESKVYIDISDFMDIKIKAFKQHKSQWMKWGSSESEHEDYFIKVKNRFIHRFRQYGLESGVKYAECFISRNRIKHVYDLFPLNR
jgi:hypothetical protein